MSTSSPTSTSSTVPVFNPVNGSSVVNKNKSLEIYKVETWRQILPTETRTMYKLRDGDLPLVDVDQLLNCSIDLANSKFQGNPPFQITFNGAVRLVVEIINRNLQSSTKTVELSCPNMGGDLLEMLSNIQTFCPDQIPVPPKNGLISASPEDHKHWLGAILAMLYENGRISNYGKQADLPRSPLKVVYSVALK